MTLPTANTPPIIETKRLILRLHRAEDLARYAALWAEEEVTRFIGGKPNTKEEAWLRLLRQAGHWPLLGFGYWIVEEKSTRTLIGEVGLAEFHRDITPSIAGVPEAGWVFASSAHGKGFAVEAMQAVLLWSASHFPENPRTVCLIHPDNAASIRLAAKLGYTELRQTVFRGQPTILFERP